MLGHLTAFSIFSFSFGYKVPPANFSDLYFLGSILSNANFIQLCPEGVSGFKNSFNFKLLLSLLPKGNKKYIAPSDYYLKPQVNLAFSKEKIPWEFRDFANLSLTRRSQEQVVFFHPRLPYHFLLFFRDRQAVHIEVMFKLDLGARPNAIVTKRKISSGNLEADLLSMRYIGRYLSIEQPGFAPDNWQTVKIDLSTHD